MARRGDNIRKRKDGRWEGRYKKGRNIDGSIIYGSVYGKSYFEVKEKLSSATTQSSNTKEKTTSTLDFCDVLSLWLSNNKVRLKGGTINKYQNIIDTHIVPELGRIKIHDITPTLINEFLSQKLVSGRIDGSGGLSSSYVRSIMLVITATLKYAVTEEMCPSLKTSINKPYIEKKEIQVLNIDEQKRLERVLSSELNEMNVGILISLHTGLRIGEICALSWDDVDLTRKVIHVRHTVVRVQNDDPKCNLKTRLVIDTPKTQASNRVIPICSSLLPTLLRLKENAVSRYVISRNISFVSPRTFEYHYHKVLRCGDIPSLNFHCLRHTFATRCIEAGVDVKSLSEILGHANVGITLNTYVHSSLEMKRTQLEKMASFSA